MIREGEFLKIKTFFEEEIHREELALYMRQPLHELVIRRMGASSSTCPKRLTHILDFMNLQNCCINFELWTFFTSESSFSCKKG